MKINKKDLVYLADLARLKLSDDEINKFKGQLSDILSFIDQLNELKLDDSHVLKEVEDLKNVWRKDEAINWDRKERELALNQGNLEAGLIVTPQVR
jgi:aspartyl-tRNA(Asn)/glutamyl-tRNA(Gln) amidotransferase subunit C